MTLGPQWALLEDAPLVLIPRVIVTISCPKPFHLIRSLFSLFLVLRAAIKEMPSAVIKIAERLEDRLCRRLLLLEMKTAQQEEVSENNGRRKRYTKDVSRERGSSGASRKFLLLSLSLTGLFPFVISSSYFSRRLLLSCTQPGHLFINTDERDQRSGKGEV